MDIQRKRFWAIVSFMFGIVLLANAPSAVACDTTGSGMCCAYYTPEGTCAQEYPCPSCFPDPTPAPSPFPGNFPNDKCTGPGMCCYHWTAPGQCAHEAPCTQC